MKILKSVLTTILTFSALCEIGYSAALVTIGVDTAGRNLQNLAGQSLTGGAPGVNGDGAALQIGYYQGATAANPFGTGLDAEFVSMIGALS